MENHQRAVSLLARPLGRGGLGAVVIRVEEHPATPAAPPQRAARAKPAAAPRPYVPQPVPMYARLSGPDWRHWPAGSVGEAANRGRRR